MVRGGSLLILRFVGQRSRSQLLKLEQKFDKNKLGTHMPDGERRKPIDIGVCRTKVKVTIS